jgi:lysozyme
MILDKATIQILMSEEGCSLKAYQDSGGVWTIGYGHTKNVKPGDKITKEKAFDFLIEDMNEAARQVNHLNLKLNQNQFTALVDLVYNFGIGHFIDSQLYKLIQKDPDLFCIKQTFLATGIRDAKGNVLQGLIKRRTREAELYFTK